jgi:MOSC domain-containing protein YiiM
VRFQFRLNKVEAILAFRAGEGNRYELIAIDMLVGEFYVSEEDELEARDIKLAEALNVQLHGGGWKKVTAVQAVHMLLAVTRPARNSVQPMPIPRALGRTTQTRG